MLICTTQQQSILLFSTGSSMLRYVGQVDRHLYDPQPNPAFTPHTCITDQDDADSQEVMVALSSNDVWPLLHPHQVNCHYPSASHPLFIQQCLRTLDGMYQTLDTTTTVDSYQPKSIPTCNSVKQAPVISLDVEQKCFVMQAEYGRAL